MWVYWVEILAMCVIATTVQCFFIGMFNTFKQHVKKYIKWLIIVVIIVLILLGYGYILLGIHYIVYNNIIPAKILKKFNENIGQNYESFKDYLLIIIGITILILNTDSLRKLRDQFVNIKNYKIFKRITLYLAKLESENRNKTLKNKSVIDKVLSYLPFSVSVVLLVLLVSYVFALPVVSSNSYIFYFILHSIFSLLLLAISFTGVYLSFKSLIGTRYIIIETTLDNLEVVNNVQNILLSERYCAGIQVYNIISKYTCKGKIEDSVGYKLSIKTTSNNYSAIKNIITMNSDCKIPQITVTKIVTDNKDYLEWIKTNSR